MHVTSAVQNYLMQIGRKLGFGVTIERVDRTGDGKFPNSDYSVRRISKNEHGWYDTIAVFSLAQMPGCCGICISHGSFVYTDYRGKGIGSILNQLRQEIAREDGYTILMCTDVVGNEPQRKLLRRNKWRDILFLNNKRTDNEVALSIKELYSSD